MIVFLALAGIFLLLPFVGWLWGPEANPKAENRPLAEMPEFALDEEFPAAFGQHFSDQFGWRQSMVRWQNIFREKVFGASDFENVLLGTDGWMFYQGGGVLNDFRKTRSFSEKSLTKIRENLLAEQKELAAYNIPLLLSLPPNKMTVYGEYLPERVTIDGSQSRLDQLQELLQSEPSLHFVDVRKRLISQAETTQVFYRTDTHWNDEGAYQGYLLLAEKMKGWFPSMPILPRNLMKENQKFFCGDLSKFLAQGESRGEEVVRYELLYPPMPINRGIKGLENVQYYLIRGRNPKGPRLLMFQDSFGFAIDPYLASSCSEALFVFDHGSYPDLIKSFRPNIVVRQVVERQLFTLANYRDKKN